MVTVGSIQPSTLQAFQGSMTYDDALSFRSLELALDDVASMPATTIPAEEQVHAAQKQQQQQKQEPAPPTRRRSISVVTPVDRSGLEEYQQQRHEDRPRVPPTYTPSSATHRLFRAAKPEPARSWKFRPANDGNTVFKGESGIDSSCSWRAAENGAPSGVIGDQQDTANNNTHFGARSPMHNTNSSSRGGREERPQNEVRVIMVSVALSCVFMSAAHFGKNVQSPQNTRRRKEFTAVCASENCFSGFYGTVPWTNVVRALPPFLPFLSLLTDTGRVRCSSANFQPNQHRAKQRA